MGARLRIECMVCQTKMLTENFFWNPGRIKVVCVNCESVIPVVLTSELLAAAEFADSAVENALD